MNRVGRLRRPLFGRHGRRVVIALCSWEVAALLTRRVPTLSELVRRSPLIGAALLGALVHHWYIEQETP